MPISSIFLCPIRSYFLHLMLYDLNLIFVIAEWDMGAITNPRQTNPRQTNPRHKKTLDITNPRHNKPKTRQTLDITNPSTTNP